MLTVRPLDDADLDAAWELGRLAFGGPRERDPATGPRPDDPVTRWGAFDESGRLVGKATDLHHDQWWGGAVLSAADVGGVAVEPEQRGRGVTRQLLTTLLGAARDRGAVVSALYPTTAAVYRSVGYEVCGTLVRADLPAAALARTVAATDVRLRAGDGTDWPALRAVYDAVARAGNGMLTRRGGPWFADPEGAALPDGLDGVTVAEGPDGDVRGYVSWERGRGYDDDARLEVSDLLALDGDAAAALLGVLGSWGTVAPTLRLRPLPWPDAVTTRLPVERLRTRDERVWMHRPVDVAAAVVARPWPSAPDVDVPLRIVDPLLAWNDGPRRLVSSAGEGRLEQAAADSDGAALHVRGWSLLWCGAARCSQLRQAGLLTGGDPRGDALLDATLGGGGRAALLDYF